MSIASTADAAFTILVLCRANKNFTNSVTTQQHNDKTDILFSENVSGSIWKGGGRLTDLVGKFDWKKFSINFEAANS